MKFNLNTEQQDAILYAVTYTLANKGDMSNQTLNDLYDILCLLYTWEEEEDRLCVDEGGRRRRKKKKKHT